MSTNAQGAAARSVPEERWLQVILVAFVMYTIAFIDRTNISVALSSISRDLHMDPAQAGSAAGVFFWGYLVLQIPGGYFARRWSAKWFIAILLVAWGACSVATGLVQTGHQFWIMRLLLGVTEGGVWPAVLVLLANWFPRDERARANGFWMLCLPLAVVLASPLSGWILGHWNWRVLLISEGSFPFVWLAVWLWRIHDHPHQARWISAAEREHLERTLEREAAEIERAEAAERALRHNSPDPLNARLAEPQSAEPPLGRALLGPQVLLMCGVYFLLNTGNYGYLFWLPTAMEKAQHLSHLLVGWLFAVPYFITGIGMVLISKHSDRHRERRLHVALPLATAGLVLLAGVLTDRYSAALSFPLIAVIGAGSYGALGPFWAIPTETLPRRVAGPAMGMVNALGNLGGYFGPLLVGSISKHTGSLMLAFSLLAASLIAGGALGLLLPKGRNRRPETPSGVECAVRT
ncbi:MAG TPA: MFS transporter [Terriglobia bacterium]|nr:MFS transporter [Terriglobia bacterium]